MTGKEDNLEKNISRLVKQAGASSKPTQAFTDSLIEAATGELKGAAARPERERKGKTMRVNWKKTLSWAAAILVVCGIGLGSFISILRTQDRSGSAAAPDSRGIEVARDQTGPRQSEIEYTEVGGRKVESDKATAVETSTTEPADRVVARNETGPRQSEIEYTEVGVKAREEVKVESGKPKDRLVAMKEKGTGKHPDIGAHPGMTSAIGVAPSTVRMKDLGEVAAARQGEKVLRHIPAEPSSRYPLAHGGTVPPNDEDVDAMFFKSYGVNPFVDTEDDHLSTFATDVDTGSYTIVRRYLQEGHLPPEKAVRVEEFVNYFKYGYAAPQEDDFAVYAEAAPWSFGEGRRNSYLLRLGLKAKQVSEESRKPAILTFVIDVSGSMNRENRLGLVKKSLRMLVERLRKEDRIGIAVYGRRGRKVMDYKGLAEKHEILAAIETLHAGGSTYAEEGIRIGYEMAEQAYKKGHINRVILCSDGVANVGRTGAEGILEVIQSKADKGITLSAIGFGMGNYNDVMLERLGDKGNGYYVYIDTIVEAKRIFGENLTGTLQVAARDVKIQVDFNPEVVRSYRLIGYENRDVPDEKFRDDKYDGGEIGAGHSVTALYELKLWPEKEGTVATTYVRYKDAETMAVTEFKSSIATGEINKGLEGSGKEFRLAATVGEFAEILRKSHWAKGAKLDSVLKSARRLSGELEEDTDVTELVDLIAKAQRLMEKEETKPSENEDEQEGWEER